MIKRYYIILLSLLTLLTACHRGVTSYVDPFIGTDGHGHTFPGAIVPFGMIQPSPDTRLSGWDGCSGYHYSDDTIYGFSHTHLSGTGCEDYCDILVMPFVDDQTGPSHFSHRNERASAGYYSVILDKGQILAELTASERTAVHRYSFPRNSVKGFVIDLTHRDKTLACSLTYDSTHRVITGCRRSASWSPNQRTYFALRANVPIDHIEYIRDNNLRSDAKAIVYLPYNAKEVELHVAISAVDEQGALANLATDGNRSFMQVHKEAKTTWEKELRKIEVKGSDPNDLTVFYTALYHCFTSPYLFSDADGRYRGGDDSIHVVEDGRRIYTVFSLWDTYRTLHPLLTLIDRQRTADFIYTFAKHYEQRGELPMWELAGQETHCMIGYHACPVILDAYNAGILDSFPDSFKRELLDAMVATSNRTEAHRAYAQQGYMNSEQDNESVSKTLEYAYDDWCIAQYAQKLAAEGLQASTAAAEGAAPTSIQSIYKIYLRRSQSWRHLLDGNGFMHARRNGAFVTPFSPAEVNNDYTEANSWQYSTYVPHDVAGYCAMMGGKARMETFLDSLFNTHARLEGRAQVDIAGLIGQYAHGNEPSHHAAYLYALIGKPYKTAKLVRQICEDFYTSHPDGLIGNEDCGQMSAWYVMSALGFYPVCPGSDQYVIGSPLFEEATIHLENGTQIAITCEGQGHFSPYVKSASVNGVDIQDNIIHASDLRNGCTLAFAMSTRAHKEFGTAAAKAVAAKPAALAAPYFTRWEKRFSDSTTVEIKMHPYASPAAVIYYTLDGTNPDTNSIRYTAPLTIRENTHIRAIAYSPSCGYSPIVGHSLSRFVADKKLRYITHPDNQYRDSGEDGLVDRMKGSTNYRIGGWQGWLTDAEMVIDMLHECTITQINVDCLSDCHSWIFFPREISIESSNDSVVWRRFGKLEMIAYNAMHEPGWNCRTDVRQSTFTITGHASARYYRIMVKNYGLLPSWHTSPGEQAWLFIDEIELL